MEIMEKLLERLLFLCVKTKVCFFFFSVRHLNIKLSQRFLVLCTFYSDCILGEIVHLVFRLQS